MAKPPALEITNISKSFKGKIVLRDVNILWEEGILGLIGPNGAGKSTLIKIISTLIRSNKGSIRIFGKNVTKESLQVRKKIGVLHENPVFHPNLRVLSSLTWIGELRGLTSTEANRHTLELLNYFRLDSAINLRIKELSAGMKQKYGLIQATIGTPPLIILDEPTSNLDPDSRNKYESYIRRLKKENNCDFLISSHVLDELDRICDGFVFLFQGAVVESGKRNNKLKKPSSLRFRILCDNPSDIMQIIIEKGLIIESVEEKSILVLTKDLNELLDIYPVLKNTVSEKEIEIVQLESKISTLYRELSNKMQRRE